MKKLIAFFLLAFIICSMGTSAFAEGNLAVTEKVFIEFDSDDSGYFFAKIENTGDTAIGVGSGKLVGFSENDDILVTEDYVGTLPTNVQLDPGEYAYVYEYIWENALKDENVVDCKFSVKESSNQYSSKTIPCEARYEYKGQYDHYIYVTFTNETNEVLYDTYITVAMYDSEGHLILVDGESADAIGVHPGSTVTLKLYVDGDLLKYYKTHSIEIGEVDAIVYQLED